MDADGLTAIEHCYSEAISGRGIGREEDKFVLAEPAIARRGCRGRFSQMSGRRRGGSGRGPKLGSIATFVALGCCLPSAPTAYADFDDLFDNVIGAAAAGAEQTDLAGVVGDPGDLGGLDIHGVLNDPLAQLDQMFHTTPDAPASAGPDAGPDAPAGPDGGNDANAGAEHSSEGGSSNNLPGLPKFSLPSTGSGSGGSGSGGSPGGSGGGDSKPKPKVNASASNGNPAAAAPEAAAVP